jgi:hypothetical protein
VHAGSVTAVMSSPRSSVVFTSGVAPGKRWKSAIGIRRRAPSARTVSAVASSARMVAIHASLPPITASWHATPPMVEQPLPGPIGVAALKQRNALSENRPLPSEWGGGRPAPRKGGLHRRVLRGQNAPSAT